MSTNQKGKRNHQYKHGFNCKGKTHPMYYIWAGMKYRCLKQDNPAWEHYGGRGITVAPHWLDFSNFYEDMGGSYRKGLSLERIDVNGNYCKENCTWIPKKDQLKNTTRTKRITYKGRSMLLGDWADYLGIKRTTLSQRIYTYKWAVEDAFTRQLNQRA